MNIKEILLERLNEIGKSLSSRQHALALLALGSVGIETDRIDEYSDLDFFVICQEGFKKRFIDNLDWLESINPIAFKFKNTKDGYKLLFKDGIFCEFAIFEPKELVNIPFSKGRIVWKSKSFDSKICISTIEENKSEVKDVEFLIGEALTNLYVGLGRYKRGEKLSAYNFIQSYAKDRVLELISIMQEPKAISEDVFSIDRRFEFRYPSKSSIISDILLGYENTPKSAEVILNFLDSNFVINEAMKDKILELIEN